MTIDGSTGTLSRAEHVGRFVAWKTCDDVQSRPVGSSSWTRPRTADRPLPRPAWLLDRWSSFAWYPPCESWAMAWCIKSRGLPGHTIAERRATWNGCRFGMPRPLHRGGARARGEWEVTFDGVAECGRVAGPSVPRGTEGVV